ncbi:hypothetical protein EB796_014228 [Bugula neritina]|uniref:Uncharacterized protein n=1 Tax=Bugula neritina TaxID=10212 RepID=A0A7J7JPW4_BUGNE|nr:hypothetical protein EB796_014228 [Bugula neritina]
MKKNCIMAKSAANYRSFSPPLPHSKSNHHVINRLLEKRLSCDLSNLRYLLLFRILKLMQVDAIASLSTQD